MCKTHFRLQAKRGLLFCLMFGCLWTGLTARARDLDLPARFYFSADAAIDASGSATISNIKGAEGALADTLKAQLQVQHFQPARLDGVVVPSTTRISAVAVLSEVDGSDVRVRVEGIRTGPWLRKVLPPMYPAEMVRHDLTGSALVVFTIAADGKPQDVRFVDVSDTRIEASLEKVVGRWRFGPEMVAGAASREPVAMPVWFYPYRKRSAVSKPTFACPSMGGRPHIAGDVDRCLDLIEVTYHE